MQALDADGDGALSAEEIDNAPKALRTLDKDGDGTLSESELRPNFPPGREGMGRRQGPEALVQSLLAFDKDGDGKLAPAELPDRLQNLMAQADTNKDGVLDAEELAAYARTRQRRPGQGGPGGERRPFGREGRGRPPGPGGENPPRRPGGPDDR
jgi:Ca2+-binding EF-hand superfamily protein